MASFDLNASATLTWNGKDGPHERRMASVREAVRVAMKELTRFEFYSAQVAASDETYSGDQIAEIYLTGRIGRSGYAAF